MTEADNPDDIANHDANPLAPASPNVTTSRQLLGDRQELLILHQGETYRLRLTKSNKLILTK